MLRPLVGGYANDIYLVHADGTDVVVRIVRPPVDVDGLEWEHRLLAQLAPSVTEVLAPLPALDGSTYFLDGDTAVVVMPYADAAPAEPWFDRLEAARALARFHCTGAQAERCRRRRTTRCSH